MTVIYVLDCLICAEELIMLSKDYSAAIDLWSAGVCERERKRESECVCVRERERETARDVLALPLALPPLRGRRSLTLCV